MDLVSSCKDKLAEFRLKELKHVLGELGLSKKGTKQDLVDRLLKILSVGDERRPKFNHSSAVTEISDFAWTKLKVVRKEDVAILIDDTYREMQDSRGANLASKSKRVSASKNLEVEKKSKDSYQTEKVRCLCGSSVPTGPMIKCEDSWCNVWQHIKCVLIPEKPTADETPSPPPVFYCEICRLSRADPFRETVSHPLYPVKLNITDVPTDGSNPCQSIEKTFQLKTLDKYLLLEQEFDVQAWCMLLNDKRTFRMQWPQYADLEINGTPVKAIDRPGSRLLGPNGRDDGPVITRCIRDEINKISLTGYDARTFCLGVRIVKRRTLHQVLSMIPEEAEGEVFEDALGRVRRCAGGGAATENADSDCDVEVVADSVPVNLRCPMSGLRMKVAGRFKPCAHMGCFDLEVFVEMNQRSKKWQCPICMRNYSWKFIIIDPYFNRIISKMQNCGEDVAEIEVKRDGSWRAKSEGDSRGLGELGLWHFPDGTISASTNAGSNSCKEFNKFDDTQGISPAITLGKNLENGGQNRISVSSTTTCGGTDCEDASVNHDGGRNLDISTVTDIERESISQNINLSKGLNDRITSASARNSEVIVLSDSEEESEPQVSARVVNKNAGEYQFPVPSYVNPSPGNSGSLGYWS